MRGTGAPLTLNRIRGAAGGCTSPPYIFQKKCYCPKFGDFFLNRGANFNMVPAHPAAVLLTLADITTRLAHGHTLPLRAKAALNLDDVEGGGFTPGASDRSGKFP